MTLINDIFEFLCAFAPLELQMSFDNSGFLVGRKNRPVKRTLLALDITPEVINEAREKGAELVIAHHPIIFSALKNITDEKLLALAQSDIAAVCMHTNLDICDGGVNDVLIRLLSGKEALSPLDEDGCGRIAELNEAMCLSDFLSLCKEKLQTAGLRYYDAGKSVCRLAVLGGAGADSLYRAHELGCDTFVTADIKYHQFLDAAELGINLIDADHFCTENPVIPMLRAMLSDKFPEVEFSVSQVHRQLISFC